MGSRLAHICLARNKFGVASASLQASPAANPSEQQEQSRRSGFSNPSGTQEDVFSKQVLPCTCHQPGIPAWLVNAQQLSPSNSIVCLNPAHGLSHETENPILTPQQGESMRPPCCTQAQCSHPAAGSGFPRRHFGDDMAFSSAVIPKLHQSGQGEGGLTSVLAASTPAGAQISAELSASQPSR